jgi:hypothetical protein
MRSRAYLGVIVLIALLGVCTQRAIAEEDLESTIKYLLAYVKNADVVFMRNDREHMPDEAADHMRRKYEHFKDQIRTPEDFIWLAGTKSLMTGKAYQVRMKDGKTVLTQRWLEDALQRYRAKGGRP